MNKFKFLSLLAITFLVLGCATLSSPSIDDGTVPNIDDGTVLKSFGLVSIKPKEGFTYRSVNAYFATNRIIGFDKESDQTNFEITGSNRNEYGVVSVSVPVTRKVGEIPRPSYIRCYLVIGVKYDDCMKGKVGDHFVIMAENIMSKNEYFADIRSRFGGLKSNDAFIFVHGFNETFDSAAFRTAQLAVDLDFKGVPFFFSWPSAGSTAGYVHDLNQSEASEKFLKEFLLSINDDTKINKIYIIAHSMGAKLTSKVISSLAKENGSKKWRFEELILAAPDVDASLFEKQMALDIAKMIPSTTIYISSRDNALKLSEMAKSKTPVLGLNTPPSFHFENIEIIDASDVVTDSFGHSYFSKGIPIVRDINQIIFESRRADYRKGLRKYENNKIKYWKFFEK